LGSYIVHLAKCAIEANRDRRALARTKIGGARPLRAYNVTWLIAKSVASLTIGNDNFPMIFAASEESTALFEDVNAGLVRTLLVNTSANEVSVATAQKLADGQVRIYANFPDIVNTKFPCDLAAPNGKLPRKYTETPVSFAAPVMLFGF
jgi:hypothetical protein